MPKIDVMAKTRRTIAVDFDGVLHKYVSPWVAPHVIADGPVDGALPWLHQMIQTFDVVIFSTRCKTWRGRRAIRRWIREHSVDHHWSCTEARGLKFLRYSYKKVPGLVYVDDRAYRFEGSNFPTEKDVFRALPWNHYMKTKGPV